MLESRNIDVKSIISVTTDGAPAMVGRERGLVARLKEDNPDMISYYCKIHQSVLCASLGYEYGELMETIMKLVNFPRSTLLEERKDETDTKYVQYIEKLINNFKVRFDDFVLGKQFLLFIQNPFLVTDITEFSVEANLTWKWVDAAKIQLELIDFQENVALKQVFCDCTPETFWSKEGSPANFPTLHRLAAQILTMFGSTYCCKSAFSIMNLVKNKFRSCMTNEQLHHCLRLAITPIVTKFRN
ncbi:general transcription factor II-I repeat domain-containing protein 2B-like [Palaemon carinicauda]|uniref:general transcription factor II-I repeat domain-containing protein 2B-like n=1 Tax=Palaemon carinicauda TaxID=392227 RepID=UPI0035B57925